MLSPQANIKISKKNYLYTAQVMVGIMLNGPNIIEERESKTIDALLCTPFTFRQIMISKGLAMEILED